VRGRRCIAGSAEAPLTGAPLQDKVDRLAACTLGADARRRIRTQIQALDTMAAMERLIGDLGG
jgi:hypothetical protein